jgi:hypothetical protein
MCPIGLIFEYSRMNVPSFSRGCEIYPPQTKIWEGWTKDEIRIFEALLGVSTRFGLRHHWKVLRKSGFHLLFILPKSSFGEHKLRNFVRHTAYTSSWCHRVFSTSTWACHHHIVRSTETSSWCHRVFSTSTSACHCHLYPPKRRFWKA